MTTITALNSNINTVTAYTPYDVNTAFPTYEGANRLERAIAILQKPKNIKKVGKDTFTVKSQFSYGTYVVTKNNDEWKCTCPDFMNNGHICKHILAVQQKLEKYNNATSKMESRSSISWTDYNLTQQTEGTAFVTYLKELVSNIEEPVRVGAGRPSAPLSELVMCAILKAYTQKSARRNTASLDVLGDNIDHVYHFNTVIKTLNREDVTPILQELVRLSALPLSSIETQFAIDSSGFRTTNFGEWCDTKHGDVFTAENGRQIRARREHEWLKCHIACGTLSNIVTDVVITNSTGEDTSDMHNFLNLLDNTNGYFNVKEISADKGYLSKENYAGAEKMGVAPFILFKSNSKLTKGCPAWNTAFRSLISKPEDWLEHYHRRSNVESTFGAIKAKFGETLRSKNNTSRINELLCKIIAYNITVVHEATISNII